MAKDQNQEKSYNRPEKITEPVRFIDNNIYDIIKKNNKSDNRIIDSENYGSHIV